MRLVNLLERVEVERVFQSGDTEISGVAYDSRKLRPGNLFVAIGGEKTDGNLFVDQAMARGAAAVISKNSLPPDFPGRWIRVKDPRRALALIAANFYGQPAHKLKLVGITGTNGKTSTAYLVESILRASGAKAGLISTIEYRGPQGTVAAERTTPESLDLQALFADFANQGGRYVVMEVSSHALMMDRVYGCQFRSAVFTNLSRDHLDYHQTLDNYFEAKKQLFQGTGFAPPQQCVINLDDPWGRKLTKICAGRPLTYSTQLPADFQILDFQVADFQRVSGMRIRLKTPSGVINLRSGLLGKPNLSNILAAVATTYDLEVEKAMIERGVELCPPIPGRFESIDCGQEFRVIVDYAHTDDALEKVLLAARDLDPKRVLLLFGCGGERDRSKRPAMGAVAERLSDYCVITSDNPRSEDPLAIINEVATGFNNVSRNCLIEPDRGKAIQIILSMAEQGDVVILAGKGHETYQVLADRTIHFDDREVARTVLKEMGYCHEPVSV
jgi:UDP-N-acetylmuramoyl-L-alanyl-D-glutamate--2,6-diaminopimelate ligase